MTQPFIPASGENRLLLIVDDDEGILSSLSTFFERHGYSVVRAATGKEALDAFEMREPDVTILDLGLPDLNGMQVLEVLRRKRAAVVLLTGQGDIPTAVRAMQLGAENFLTKPPNMPHLVAAVERAIEKADLRRENRRLLKLVPTTRKRLARLAVTAVLVAAAAAIGLAVGGMGSRQAVGPEIAPTRLPVTNPPPSSRDTFPLVPGAPQRPAPPSR